jgi:hypothetical protein
MQPESTIIEFNTGYIYEIDRQFEKAYDIHTFGGEEDALFDVYGHKWSANDKPVILQSLDNTPPFDQFAFSVEGTNNLYNFLIRSGQKKNLIGSIIYHQLLYCDPLRAWYTEDN